MGAECGGGRYIGERGGHIMIVVVAGWSQMSGNRKDWTDGGGKASPALGNLDFYHDGPYYSSHVDVCLISLRC